MDLVQLFFEHVPEFKEMLFNLKLLDQFWQTIIELLLLSLSIVMT